MTRTPQEHQFLVDLNACARESRQREVDRLQNFPAWTPRQNIARFLAAAEIYPQIVGLHGVVIEGGIGGGAGLFTWAHLASILEPYNYSRRIVGFDFGTLDVLQDLHELSRLHDCNRPLGHIARIEIVPGDAIETMPKYREEHPDLRVAMLVLDFTSYEPTKAALDTFWPCMPSGGVVVSGGIWMDELRALVPYPLSFRRVPWSSTLIWAVKP